MFFSLAIGKHSGCPLTAHMHRRIQSSGVRRGRGGLGSGGPADGGENADREDMRDGPNVGGERERGRAKVEGRRDGGRRGEMEAGQTDVSYYWSVIIEISGSLVSPFTESTV